MLDREPNELLSTVDDAIDRAEYESVMKLTSRSDPENMLTVTRMADAERTTIAVRRHSTERGHVEVTFHYAKGEDGALDFQYASHVLWVAGARGGEFSGVDQRAATDEEVGTALESIASCVDRDDLLLQYGKTRVYPGTRSAVSG